MRVPTSDLDRQIMAALQLNGRAPWKQIAHAIEAPESTVARRGQHLLHSGVIAVTGVLDYLRCGLGISFQVRLRCRPGRSTQVGQALARLPATTFVTQLSGSADLAVEFLLPTHHEVARVLGDDLPCPDDIVETESMMVTRKFCALEEWDTGLLSGAATRMLRPDSTMTHYQHRQWTEAEQLTPRETAIAEVLASDGRASYTQIARAVGIGESTAARRLESLVRRGCLRFRAIFDVAQIGLGVEFMQWLQVAPSAIDSVGTELAKLRSTRYVSATTGRYNLCLHGALPSYADLYHYMTDVIGAIPHILTSDITLLSATLKDTTPGRDHDDEREKVPEPVGS